MGSRSWPFRVPIDIASSSNYDWSQLGLLFCAVISHGVGTAAESHNEDKESSSWTPGENGDFLTGKLLSFMMSLTK